MKRREILIAAGLAPLATGGIAQGTSPALGAARIRAAGAVPLTPGSAIHATPPVRDLLRDTTPAGDIARRWLEYFKGLGGTDGVRLEDVVTPDVRCIELQLAGLPGDFGTLREFRTAMNGALAYTLILLEDMIITPGPNLAEVRLHAEATHSGTLMGIPATGRQISYDVRTLNLFKDGKMALRWDRSNLDEVIRSLASPPK